MASMLAIVNQKWLESELKHHKFKGQPGEVFPWSSYESNNEHLAKLNGGSLFLVTVRPTAVLLLVAIYEETEMTQGGIEALEENTTPIVDITHLHKRFKFKTGTGLSAVTGYALQTPRVLTEEDERLLRDAIKEATQDPPEESEPEAGEFPEGKKVYVMHARLERSPALVAKAKQEHQKAHKGALPCSVCGFDFAKEYGAVGEDFAEVHHTIPLKDYEKLKKKTTQLSDLVIVCSNCHRMLHRRRPWLTLADLKQLKAPTK